MDFQPKFIIYYLSYCKSNFEDNLRSNPSFMSIEKKSLSIRILFSQFRRQSYVKTVRDPCSCGMEPYLNDKPFYCLLENIDI